MNREGWRYEWPGCLISLKPPAWGAGKSRKTNVKPQRDRRQPQGEKQNPQRDGRQPPRGKAKPPTGSTPTPKGKRKTPNGIDANPQGEKQNPQRDRRQPQGEKQNPQREKRFPQQDQLEPLGISGLSQRFRARSWLVGYGESADHSKAVSPMPPGISATALQDSEPTGCRGVARSRRLLGRCGRGGSGLPGRGSSRFSR
jgi:hypothetical protein